MWSHWRSDSAGTMTSGLATRARIVRGSRAARGHGRFGAHERGGPHDRLERLHRRQPAVFTRPVPAGLLSPTVGVQADRPLEGALVLGVVRELLRPARDSGDDPV